MVEDDKETNDQGDNSNASRRIVSDLPTFTEVVTNFYRGEVDRATAWRARLDQTTNWAVVVVAAVLTWAFSGDNRPHYVILIGVFAVTAFLFMEANRYQEYDVWRNRVRIVQSSLMAEAFAPSEKPNDDWRAELGEQLRNPTLQISFWAATNHRLRRSYFALLSVLLIAWIARITAYASAEPWRQTAAILLVPGEVVVSVVGLFYAFLAGVTAWSARGEHTEEFQA